MPMSEGDPAPGTDPQTGAWTPYQVAMFKRWIDTRVPNWTDGTTDVGTPQKVRISQKYGVKSCTEFGVRGFLLMTASKKSRF